MTPKGYYLEQNHEEIWYNEKMSSISDREKAEMAFVLKLPIGFTDKELYLAMLEASAKLLRVPKYQIYTVDTLGEIVKERYEALADKVNLPRFTHVFIDIGEDKKMNLKGRNFLTLKDFTPEEITYLLDLRRMIWEWGQPTWIRQVLRSGKKRVSKIRRVCSDGCTTGLNIADLARRLWRNWQNMQEFRCGTD